MHADGYAGFDDLYRSGTTREVACMAHVRRKFVDIYRSQGSPIAEDAIGRIAQLYAVEKEARSAPPDRRTELRKAHAAPVFDDLERWLAMQLTTISGKSPLAAAIRYALTRMERLRPYLDHGILELDNNAAERGMEASRRMAFRRQIAARISCRSSLETWIDAVTFFALLVMIHLS
jgi:transposase